MAEEAGALLLQFADGTPLTTEDVGNIEITYPLNEETDVTVGKCVSAELRCTVLNYHGLLSGYGFGRCSVSMGVMVGAEEWAMPTCRAAVVHGYGTASAVTVSAHEDAPFLRVNGSAGSSQPTFSPDCLVLMGDTLYAGDGTNLWAATIDGTILTAKAVDNDFLAYKLGKWSGKGISYQGNMAYEFSDAVYKYEYVPLGTFYFDTPEQRRVANISCEALDGMQKFNVDVDDWWAGLKWPLTRGQLLQSLCAEVGVTLKTTTFPGSAKSIASAPMAGNGFVGKDVLGWIAETACAYARMSRDDALELVWFAFQNVKLTKNQHFGDSPAEYETPAVEALHVMVANTDLGVMLPENGTGNEYQVLDNPLYYGSTEAEIRGKAQDLYEKLTAFPAYTPNSVDAVCDWSIEPGDIIQVVGGDGTTRTLPIFRMTLKWGGGWARATYECTGGTGRKPAPQSKRREFAAYRAYHKLEVDIQGIHSEIGDVKGNVANLEITASELRTQISGKIDGSEAQSLIDQTVDKISLEVSSDSTGSTFVIKKDGVEISSDKVDLHVNALNVDGEIVATSINLSTANITGTLSAAFIDASNLHVDGANIDNLTVSNAQIESLYASKIVGGGGTSGGYLPQAAISDTGRRLDYFYSKDGSFSGTLGTNDVTVGGGVRLYSGEAIGAELTYSGVSAGGTSKTWAQILSGSGSAAVFG
nr:MAG TPA_asm: hypothetical protein [Caudoviricetes sp.]